MDNDKRNRSTTTSGLPPEPGHENGPAPAPIDPRTGMHRSYWVLSEEERAKGFVRPVRRSYQHTVCGTVTTMGVAIAETYARQPAYYGATFCVNCRNHFRVGEDGDFIWVSDDYQIVRDGDGSPVKVGT